jgi:hypothetical protein
MFVSVVSVMCKDISDFFMAQHRGIIQALHLFADFIQLFPASLENFPPGQVQVAKFKLELSCS